MFYFIYPVPNFFCVFAPWRENAFCITYIKFRILSRRVGINPCLKHQKLTLVWVTPITGWVSAKPIKAPFSCRSTAGGNTQK